MIHNFLQDKNYLYGKFDRYNNTDSIFCQDSITILCVYYQTTNDNVVSYKMFTYLSLSSKKTLICEYVSHTMGF